MTAQTTNTNWKAVGLFYFVACAVSWPFFWWRDMARESWISWNAPGLVKTATYMWGPGIAALIAFLLFRKTHNRRITLLGTSAWRSVLFYLLPLAALAMVGVRTPQGRINHVLPAILPLAAFLTIVGEELGWRGFLQDALHPLAPWKRYALIGVLWEAWHFTNRIHHRSAGQIAVTLAVSYPVAVILSWMIGEATERSRSLLVAVALHGWFNLCFEFAGLRTWIVAGASIPLFAWLLWTWKPAEDQPDASPANSC